MAISGPIGEARRNGFCATPILLCPLCCANTIGAAVFILLTGKARQIIKINKFLFIGTANAYTLQKIPI
jgi:hypothetical protein